MKKSYLGLFCILLPLSLYSQTETFKTINFQATHESYPEGIHASHFSQWDRLSLGLHTEGNAFRIEDWRQGSSNIKTLMYVGVNGYVGIGTTTPSTKFHIGNGVVTSGTESATKGTLQFAGYYRDGNILNTYGSQYSSGATSIGYAVRQKSGAKGFISTAGNASLNKGILIIDNELEFLNAGASTVPIGDDVALSSRFIIKADGSVGVGTSSTGSHKLAVEGSIGAREIQVEANGWSDFVFEDNYELKSLEETEQFIKENKHLPDVPNESEVLEKGINLGEMDSKLLQKIEELTLYMIEMNKELKNVKEKNLALEEEIRTLKEK